MVIHHHVERRESPFLSLCWLTERELGSILLTGRINFNMTTLARRRQRRRGVNSNAASSASSFGAATASFLCFVWISLLLFVSGVRGCMAFPWKAAPAISPATGLPNRFYEWKEGQRIRYQCNGPSEGKPVVLVHGLFVNSDHWRKSLQALGDAGYRAFALDMFGCGYSSKPDSRSEVAQKCNGELERFGNGGAPGNGDDVRKKRSNVKKQKLAASILKNIDLGSADGVTRRIRDVDLRHPLSSPYNFYTWADLITDFCYDVVLGGQSDSDIDNADDQVTLVANSIGCISSFQAVIDTPDLYDGVFAVSPNFRELHSAEVTAPQVSMPMLRYVQKQLRDNVGPIIFPKLAKPDVVKSILKVPYAVDSAVDDTLVKVLLDPLLTEGASQVVFDTLSYSAGPLPEQQLAMFPPGKPVWVGYGTKDPWTPGPRVEALSKYEAVERVVAWNGVGHCPHDEAPELVHPVLFEFLSRLSNHKKNADVDDASKTTSTNVQMPAASSSVTER